MATARANDALGFKFEFVFVFVLVVVDKRFGLVNDCDDESFRDFMVDVDVDEFV